nr:hypothetical protein [Thermoanaerobaculia bacterium]
MKSGKPLPSWLGWATAFVVPAAIAFHLVPASSTLFPARNEVQASDPEQAESSGAENYLRALPAPSGQDQESKTVLGHAARQWYLLTYPKGRIPSQPWDRARAWVRRHVADAPAWKGDSLQAPDDGFSWALTPPGTNSWVAYGPKPLDSVGTTNNAYQYGLVGGRVAEGGLAVDPVSPNVAYAGFAAGGLWKTTNLGSATVTWTPLWEGKDFVTQAASAIEIDPTDHNTVYVGTGDWAAKDQFGAGVMKTTDGGTTWTQLGASVFTPYSPTLPAGGNRWDNQNIRVIKVDPNNPSNVLVGTRVDLYISHDAGSTWQICGFGNGYTDPSAANTTQNALNRVSSIVLDARGANT